MKFLKSGRALALVVAFGISLFTGCQASRGVGNNPSGSGPAGGSSIILPGGEGSSSPGGGPGSPLGPVGMSPVPDGTLGASVDQPEVTKSKGLIYGHNPRDMDPSLTTASIRRVSWSSDSQAAVLWAGLSLHQIQATIIDEGVSWEVVQQATWRDFPVSYEPDNTLLGMDDIEKDVTGPMLFFWLPANQIPIASNSHFSTLEEFLNLYK